MNNQNIKQPNNEIHNAGYWAGLIDFTYLKEDRSISKILDFFDASIQYGARGVCSWLDVFAMEDANKILAEKIVELRNKGILLIGVINFPDGNGGVDLIKREVRMAKDLQLDEVDMVLNAEAFNESKYKIIEEEIKIVADLFSKKTKLILETGALEKSDFEKAVELANSRNISFVKTSTGFNYNIDFEEKVEHVKILADIIKKNNYNLKIKISGGIRTLEQLKVGKNAGADVFGVSYGSAIEILKSL